MRSIMLVTYKTMGAEAKETIQASVGMRVAVHPAHDRFMRGDRYGTVDIVRPGPVGASGDLIRVLLDTSRESVWFNPKDLLANP